MRRPVSGAAGSVADLLRRGSHRAAVQDAFLRAALRKERFDLMQQVAVTRACVAQKRCTLCLGARRRLVVQLLDAPPAVELHDGLENRRIIAE